MLAIISTLIIFTAPVLWWVSTSTTPPHQRNAGWLALLGAGIGMQIYLNRLLIYFYMAGHYWLP